MLIRRQRLIRAGRIRLLHEGRAIEQAEAAAGAAGAHRDLPSPNSCKIEDVVRVKIVRRW